VVLLFLETLRDAPRLAAAARAAHAAGKAIVAYKLGRSSLGATLAVSHTGAIAGEDVAYDAFFQAHGIVRVEMIETLLEIGPLLARGVTRSPEPALMRARVPRVAVVSTTGGGAAMVVDRLGLRGIDAEHIHADLKDGVLTVMVPRTPEAQVKKIAVKTERPKV
jgi:acyl-CoA synthetase (NDP forming)